LYAPPAIFHQNKIVRNNSEYTRITFTCNRLCSQINDDDDDEDDDDDDDDDDNADIRRFIIEYSHYKSN